MSHRDRVRAGATISTLLLQSHPSILLLSLDISLHRIALLLLAKAMRNGMKIVRPAPALRTARVPAHLAVQDGGFPKLSANRSLSAFSKHLLRRGTDLVIDHTGAVVVAHRAQGVAVDGSLDFVW